MSLKISKTDFGKELTELKKDCRVIGKPNPYGPLPYIDSFGETSNSLYLPFAYAKKRFKKSPNNTIDFPKTIFRFKDDEFPFRTDGGRDQEKVFNESLRILKEHKSLILSLFCGFGKTYTAIRLAQYIGLKTAVLAHRSILFEQWISSIQQFSDAKVQKVDTNGLLDPTVDFYIFNIGFVHKKWSADLKKWIPKNLGAYKNIGLLIIDEAHVACAEELSKSLMYFNPRFVIALTATPNRSDGLDKILELYFGNYSDTRIIRQAENPFIVYRVSTGIKPTFSFNIMGKKDWNSVIESVVNDPNRNQLIINLVQKYSENIIIILTKRKDHCKILSDELNKLNITNTILVGTNNNYDKTARVLLSTYSKTGVGFDDSRLNMLIVACSVTEIEQYCGRLRDNIGKNRLVFDLVDCDPNCQKHWLKRKEWYLSRNGIVKNYTLPNTPIIEPEEPTQSPEEKEPTKRLARKL